jgi:hypothetical protein
MPIRAHVLPVVVSMALLSAGCSKPAASPPQSTAASPAAAAPIDPSTVASISGVVRYSGQAPPPQKVDMSADSGCKGQNQSEAVLVNDGRLANVLVYVKAGLAARSRRRPAKSPSPRKVAATNRMSRS